MQKGWNSQKKIYVQATEKEIMYKRKESLNIAMKSLEMSPQVLDIKTIETKCLQTILWAGPLNSPNPQIYDYYTPSKWSTPRTTVTSSKYLMNASPSNFSTQPTDQTSS